MTRCICLNRSPEDYDGPMEDCPVHGVKACLAQAQAEVELLRAELARAQQATAEARRLAQRLADRLDLTASVYCVADHKGLDYQSCAERYCKANAEVIAATDHEALAADVPAASEATP